MSFGYKFSLVFLIFFSCQTSACIVISSVPPEYVYLVKMSGRKIQGLKYDEISGDLFYEGESSLSIYVKESSGKKRIALFEGGSLCRSERESSKESCIDRSEGFNLPRYFGLDDGHSYPEPEEWPVKGTFQKRIYLQTGNSSYKKYILQELRVRNTEAIQEKLHATQYSLCDGSIE